MNREERSEAGRNVTWISIELNLLLVISKCVIGYFSSSKALIADGVHSLADLSTDVAVLLGLRFSDQPKDADHPYGHHKFSTVAQLFIGFFLLIFSIGLILTSVYALKSSEVRVPGKLAFFIALVGLIAKEALFWWTRYIARAVHSKLILANAWHHRADSISSLVVVLALLVPLVAGPSWAILDEVVGAALGTYLLWEGFKIMKSAVVDLLDTAPEMEIIEDLREHILPTPGVVAYHDFRARPIGDMLEVDMHLQVDPNKTVREGHDIARLVRERILGRHPEVFDVLIHIEPADPEHIKERGIHGVDEDA